MGETDTKQLISQTGLCFQMVAFLLPTASESRQDSAANVTSTNGSNSISMSVEINGIMYTGNTSTASFPRLIQESWVTPRFGLCESPAIRASEVLSSLGDLNTWPM